MPPKLSIRQVDVPELSSIHPEFGLSPFGKHMRLPLVLIAYSCAVLASFAAEPRKARPIDPYLLNANTLVHLQQNAALQMEALKNADVFHDFQFSDEYQASGIRFEHVAVEDAAKHWKPAHYDHGSALAAADVDQDGRIDLYFVNQLGANELWRSKGNGKFEDITKRAGVALEDKISVGASFADINNDGLPDLFVTSANQGNTLFINQGGGKFRDATTGSGLELTAHSSGAVFFDFDRDGLLDLFVVNVGQYTLPETGPGGFYRANPKAFTLHLEPQRAEQSVLYRNLGGGKFADVSEEVGLQHSAWSGDASFSDLNLDGFPDLYVVTMQGDDKYYENQQGKRFVDKTDQYFPRTPWGAMGLKFFDYNQDGHMDLFLTDMHSDMTQAQTTDGKKEYSTAFEKQKSEAWCSIEWTDAFLQGASNNVFGNAFYHNNGNGSFQEISDGIGAETYWPWGITVADLNADGFEDVFVTAGMGWPFRYGINSVLLNEKGRTFRDSEYALRVEPRKGLRIQKDYFTLDCSGADKDNPICEGRRGMVAVRGSISSRSSAALDLDDDGDLDIITNEQHDRPIVFVSNLSEKQKINFLKIKLVGTLSNRDGLGALVKVTAEDETYSQSCDGKSGYLAQSSIPLYFGLGGSPIVQAVEVLWPSGKKQILRENIRPNHLLTITEPADD